MQVAVAQMRHVHEADPGVERPRPFRRALQQRLHPVERHRNVVVDQGCAQARHLRRRLAACPHLGPFRAGLGNDRVEHRARAVQPHQHLLQMRGDGHRAVRRRCGVARGDGAELDEDVDLVARVEGRARVGKPLQVGVHVAARHVLERLHRAARLGLQRVQQVERAVQVGRGHHGRGMGQRPREQADDRRRDDPERPFRPDHQVAQVIAGIVLVQGTHQVQHLALRRDRLDPEAELAGGAVADHVRAARVGGQAPADHGRAARAEGEREDQPLRLGRRVQPRQDDPGLHDGDTPGGVHLADGRHPVERQHDRPVGAGALGQPRVAGDRHHRRAAGVGQFHHLGHLGRGPGADDRARRPRLHARPVMRPWRGRVAGGHVSLAHDRGEGW